MLRLIIIIKIHKNAPKAPGIKFHTKETVEKNKASTAEHNMYLDLEELNLNRAFVFVSENASKSL